MTDKTVTYEDLDAIAVIERECSALSCEGQAIELLRRLRAAAEADRPPLPEGWVLLRLEDEEYTALWHQDGMLWTTSSAMTLWSNNLARHRDRLTPLRPTIAEADVEKAADAFLAASEGMSTKGSLRAAFEAAGIEVRDA